MGSVVISDIELMKNLLAHFLAAPRSQKQSAQNSDHVHYTDPPPKNSEINGNGSCDRLSTFAMINGARS